MKVLYRAEQKEKNERGNGILGSKPNQMVFLQQIFYPGHWRYCYSDPDEDAWSVNAIVEKVAVSSGRSHHYFDVVVDVNHDFALVSASLHRIEEFTINPFVRSSKSLICWFPRLKECVCKTKPLSGPPIDRNECAMVRKDFPNYVLQNSYWNVSNVQWNSMCPAHKLTV